MTVLSGIAIFSFPYFLSMLLVLSSAVLLTLLSKSLGKRFANRLILFILWANFALHFLKQLSPYYLEDFPTSLAKSSFENLCSVLIVISPFLYLFGGKYGRDYLYYIGAASCLVVLFGPTGLDGVNLHSLEGYLEAFRFYACHAPLLFVGPCMCAAKIHELNYRRLWAIPFMFCLVQLLIFVNDMLLNLTLYSYPWDIFFSRYCGMSNASFTMGPSAVLDPVFGGIYPYLPRCLMTYIGKDGMLYFVPVLWLFLPVAILTAILGPLFALPFDHTRIMADLRRGSLRLMRRPS